MAGEAIRDANFEARQRLSNDPEEAARRAGLVGDKYDVSGYSDKEISMALMGSSFGDEDYERLTGKSIGGDDDDKPGKPPGGGDGGGKGPGSGDGGNSDGSYNVGGGGQGGKGNINIRDIGDVTNDTRISNTQTQNINQDNDISTSISGDNNVVTNDQDNSISQSMGSSDYATRYARGLKDKYVLNLLGR